MSDCSGWRLQPACSLNKDSALHRPYWRLAAIGAAASSSRWQWQWPLHADDGSHVRGSIPTPVRWGGALATHSVTLLTFNFLERFIGRAPPRTVGTGRVIDPQRLGDELTSAGFVTRAKR